MFLRRIFFKNLTFWVLKDERGAVRKYSVLPLISLSRTSSLIQKIPLRKVACKPQISPYKQRPQKESLPFGVARTSYVKPALRLMLYYYRLLL